MIEDTGRIGFVGAGRMGRPMVERLLGAGVPTSVYARRPGLARELEALGAVRSGSLRELAAEADVVVVCVFTDEQVAAVCLGPDGLVASMRPDATLVVHTTGSPVTSARLDEATRAQRCHSLDVPVSGSAADIVAGSLTLLAGGDGDALERCRPTLSAYGHPILHVGGVGDGQRVKLVNNALLAAHLELARRAVAMGDALGIDARTLAGAVVHGSGASRAMAMMASAASPRDVLDNVREFLAKDLDVVERVADQLGLDLGEIGALAAAAVRSGGTEAAPLEQPTR